jgi:hypothetical protein
VSGTDYLPVRWERAVWADGDVEGAPIVFFFEFNADGAVLRQIELAGPPPGVPTAAASLLEFWEAQGGIARASTSALLKYQERFGNVAEGSREDWGPEYLGQPISSDEFEEVWRRARAHLSAKRD